MSKIKNPQEKKRLSYTKDRRNCYGENDKSSRKNIRRNKKLSSKKLRGSASGLNMLSAYKVDTDFANEVEAEVHVNERINRLKGFKKVGDQSLKSHIDNQRLWRGRRYGRRANS